MECGVECGVVTSPSPVATAVLATLRAGGARARLAFHARKALAGKGLIARTTLAGRPMLLPLEHDLPVILAEYPNYGRNLGRLAALLAGPVIDIGANVGDTVALIREVADVPCLAIEGDETYLPLLRANLAGLVGVEVEECYVASDLTVAPVTPTRIRGTATLTPTRTAGDVQLRRLDEIIADHPVFSGTTRLVKIDTDGADAAIIVANAGWFADIRPVVFWEYDALWATRLGDPAPWRAFACLAEAGYDRAVVWVNTGELLLVARAGDVDVWRDLAGYMNGPGRQHYLDVAVFHRDDDALAGRFVEGERAALS